MVKTPLKICLVASAGGHLSQLQALSAVWAGHPVCWITSLEVGADRLRAQGPTYVVGECNREHPMRVVTVFWQCWRAIRRERPDVVLSTGAAPGILSCLIGRLHGARVIWVDSIANTRKLSLSGWLVRPIAHLVMSQWPEVAARYPGVHYAGEVV